MKNTDVYFQNAKEFQDKRNIIVTEYEETVAGMSPETLRKFSEYVDGNE